MSGVSNNHAPAQEYLYKDLIPDESTFRRIEGNVKLALQHDKFGLYSGFFKQINAVFTLMDTAYTPFSVAFTQCLSKGALSRAVTEEEMQKIQGNHPEATRESVLRALMTDLLKDDQARCKSLSDRKIAPVND